MAAASVILAGCQKVGLSLTAVTAERRPALLSDAAWGKPSTAVKFNKRFGTGVPERELLSWLDKNRFAVDRDERRAERVVHGFPCNEFVRVSWSDNAPDRLGSASAEVKEAGCL